MEFNYDNLIDELFNLQCSIDKKTNELKKLEDKLSESHKFKYIDLLWEFYFEACVFTDISYPYFNNDNEEDINYLLSCFEKFELAYSKVLAFLDFSDVPYEVSVFDDFSKWRKLRKELLESLK